MPRRSLKQLQTDSAASAVLVWLQTQWASNERSASSTFGGESAVRHEQARKSSAVFPVDACVASGKSVVFLRKTGESLWPSGFER